MPNINETIIPEGTPTVDWIREHRPDYRAGAIFGIRRQAASAIREFGLAAILATGLIRLRKLECHSAHAQAPHKRVEAAIREFNNRQGVRS